MSTKKRFKLNYHSVGDWLRKSPQVAKALEKAGEKVVKEVKKNSNLAEQRMQAVYPSYEIVSPKIVEYEKGEVTNRQTGRIVLKNATPADYLYNPFVE